MRQLKAFSVIELLIVVTIISVLAAIAVPSFLDSQVRSKVARVKADHRTLATALEAYFIDHGSYPPNNNGVSGADPSANARTEFILPVLSTPISYLTISLLHDPFESSTLARFVADPDVSPDYGYFNGSSNDMLGNAIVTTAIGLGDAARTFKANQWWLVSIGPDRSSRTSQLAVALGGDPYVPPPSAFVLWVSETGTDPILYDPTNGTISQGDVIRTHKGIFEPSLVGL